LSREKAREHRLYVGFNSDSCHSRPNSPQSKQQAKEATATAGGMIQNEAGGV
jgi:hypothetical protein